MYGTLLEKMVRIRTFKGSNPCPVFRTLNGSHVEPLSYGFLKNPQKRLLFRTFKGSYGLSRIWNPKGSKKNLYHRFL